MDENEFDPYDLNEESVHVLLYHINVMAKRSKKFVKAHHFINWVDTATTNKNMSAEEKISRIKSLVKHVKSTIKAIDDD